MDDVDLHAWFKSDELESRAPCGEQGSYLLADQRVDPLPHPRRERRGELPDAGTERSGDEPAAR